MVQIKKSQKKAVYHYLLHQTVIVIHKDFTTQPHKGTNVPNIHVRTLLRSLYSRGFVKLIFNWQYFYYFLNNEGKNYLTEYLGMPIEFIPNNWNPAYKYLHPEVDEHGQTLHNHCGYQGELRFERLKALREGRSKDAPLGQRRGGRGGPHGEQRQKKQLLVQEKPAQSHAE